MKALIILSSSSRIVMFVTSIICLYNGIKYYNKIKSIKGFIFLSLLSIADSLSYIYLVIIEKNKTTFYIISEQTQILYHVVEIGVILYFFISKNYDQKVLIKKHKTLIFALLTLLYLYNILIHSTNTFLILSELIIVNTLCINYFFSTYKKKISQIDTHKYLINGLFIFINITAPYYILENNIEKTTPFLISYINFINDLGYTILFLSINKEVKWIALK